MSRAYARDVALRCRLVLTFGCLLLSVTGCSSPFSSTDPPTLTVQGAGAPVDLRPWSYCWGHACADGAPPQSLPSVGAADRVRVAGSEIGLGFSAQFAASKDDCARVQHVFLGTMGKDFSLWPAGPAGTYDVQLHVEGAQGHSASYSFQWTTTRDGVWPVPAASTSVLADNDGTITSYGVNLSVENLALTPRRASATIEVTSAEGLKTTIQLRRAQAGERCEPTGSIRFEAPETEAQPAIASGSAPFRYQVLLVLDGRNYRAAASWPDDQIPDYHPYVKLQFRPELPALPRS